MGLGSPKWVCLLMPNEQGYSGLESPNTDSGQYNALSFMVRRIVGENSHATLVQVKSCTNDGGLSPVGFVDVHPLVNQLDGSGKAVPHGTVHELPYFRLQGGANAIICDPEPGDIGIAVFADQDISSVKATKAEANPGSYRHFDMADGLYLGGFLNGTPSQYVQFNNGGITITTPNDVNVNADGNVTVNAGADCNVNATGNVLVTAAAATIQAASIALQSSGSALKSLLNSVFKNWADTHTHDGGSVGSGTTGAPTTTAGSNSETSVVSAE